MDKYPSDYFPMVRRLFLIGGIWLPKFTSTWYKIYGIFIISSAIILHTVLEGVILKETYWDLDAIVKNLSMFIQHASGAVKSFVWIINSKKILEIIETVESPKYHYESCNNFQPGAIITRYRKQNQFLTSFYFGAAMNVAMSASLTGYSNFFKIPNWINQPIKGIYSEKLPFYIWTPFDITGSRKTYFWVLSFEAFSNIWNAFIIAGVDQLLMNLMRIVTAHVVVLQGAIRSIRERALQKLDPVQVEVNLVNNNALRNSKELEQQMFQELFKCIEHSQELIKICEEMERIYKYIVLMQYATTTIMSCTTLFIVSTIEIGSNRFVAEMSYLSAIYVQISCVSWIGHQLFHEWGELPQAIFESDWYAASKQYKSTVRLMMRRFLNPIKISIGNFAPLSLTSLVQVVRISYSFFALIKNSKD